MLLHLLAIPIGLVIMIAILILVALIAEYSLEVFSILVILGFGYWIGSNVLGLIN